MLKQLAKTTPFLTGNYKIDIILKNTSTDNSQLNFIDKNKNNKEIEYLIDDYINLMPLSKNIPYSNTIKNNIYNYTLKENLKHLYKDIKDYFFEDMGDFQSNNILYNNYKIDTYDHTYNSCLKRANYNLYGKQFHFFCPIYLTNTADIDKISFRISVKGEGVNTQDNMIKHIKLTDILKNYLKNYLLNVDDNILNLYISKKYGNIQGLDISTGVDKNIDISYIFDELLKQEKTLIDFDNVIISTFKQNNIIIKQILNLDFFFSPSDIFPRTIIQNLLWKRWNIYIDVLEDNKKVDFVDIYSNYNNIPKCIIENYKYTFNNNINVLDYLSDNKDVKNIFLNKSTQPICHWSIVENDNYIYNFYNGFSPLMKYNADDNITQTIINGGYFYNQCNFLLDKYSKNTNNLSWCKVNRIIAQQSFLENELGRIYNDINNYTHIDINNIDNNKKILWINNNKYNISNLDKSEFTDFYVAIAIINDDNYIVPPISFSNYDNNNTNTTDNIIIYSNDNRLLIVVKNNIESLSQIVFKNAINNFPSISIINNNNTINTAYLFNMLKKILNTFEAPNKIIFNKSISPQKNNIKLEDSTEIQYKQINKYIELYRYEGNLKPTFIKCDNYNLLNNIYFNEDWRYLSYINFDNINISQNMEYNMTQDDEKLNYYLKYSNKLKSLAEYPSINYFPMVSNKSIYYSLPDYYKNYIGDISYYKSNYIYFLPENFDIQFIESSDIYIDEGYLKDYLLNYYKLDADKLNYYIFPLYNYNINLEYISIYDIKNIKYTINFVLK